MQEVWYHPEQNRFALVEKGFIIVDLFDSVFSSEGIELLKKYKIPKNWKRETDEEAIFICKL